MSYLQWEKRPSEENHITQLVQLGYPPVLAELLAQRGISTKIDTEKELSPTFGMITKPFAIPGLRLAAERIYQGMINNERILIYGDYDVDGVTSVSLLKLFFRTCGYDADFFIPNRMTDGYGLTLDIMPEIKKFNPDLIITVDCGITAVTAVKTLREQYNIEVVISDHHLPDDELPDTPYIVNPKLSSKTPYENLCGSGTAFMLAWGTAILASGSESVRPGLRDYLLQAMPLTAIATIADIVALNGDNRLIAAQGLKQLRNKEYVLPGLIALMDISNLSEKNDISSEDIGFKICPRLNAAGRLDKSNLCVELLTEPSLTKATQLARRLNDLNQERRKLCEVVTNEAEAMIRAMDDLDTRKTLVVGKADWHKGVIGIVAAKLTELFRRPAVVFTLIGDHWNGSARSAGSFHLRESLDLCSDLLLRYGGHKGAAGVTLHRNNLDEFGKRFEETADKLALKLPSEQKIFYNCEISLEDVHVPLMSWIELLGPFGEANQRPLFKAENVYVQDCMLTGNGQHLRVIFYRYHDYSLSAIMFYPEADLIEKMKPGVKVDILFTGKINTWNNHKKVDVILKEVRVHDEPEIVE